MNFEYLLSYGIHILRQLSAEDMMLLAVIFVLFLDRKCDRTFMGMLVLIFVRELQLKPFGGAPGTAYSGGPFRHF